MFVFKQDGIHGRGKKAVPANKFFSDGVLEETKKSNKKDANAHRDATKALDIMKVKRKDRTSPVKSGCGCFALDRSMSTENSSQLSSRFSISSDESSMDSDCRANSTVTQSNMLYKPSFDSPIDRLLLATDKATPKRQALNILNQFHTWATIEAQIEIIQTYSWEIRKQAIPKLLEYIRWNVEDHECVSEALAVLETLTSLSFVLESKRSSKALVLIEAKAIDILCLALLTHKNDINPEIDVSTSHRKQRMCLFQRLWNFLMKIVLSPSALRYFQTGSSQQQKQYERRKLVAAVYLCLDRILHFSFEFGTASSSNLQHSRYMNQVLKTLVMLLSFQTQDGTTFPNKSIRKLLRKRRIFIKCQQIMTDRMDQNDWEVELGETEQQQELILNALELFQKCLSDCNDCLSKSVDDVFVEHFVYHILPKFSNSSSIQTKGWQILNDISLKRNDVENGYSFPTKNDESFALSLGLTTRNSDDGKENQVYHFADLEKMKSHKLTSIIDVVESVFSDPSSCLHVCDDRSL